MGITAIITILTSVSSSVIAGCLMFYINRREKKEDEREEARLKRTYLLLKNIQAQGSVLEKVAVCVKNGRVNGDMEEALQYQMEMKHELKDFLDEQAINH